MHAHSAKQEALHAIERLPDDVPFDEIVYRLYVLGKVQQGLKDIDAFWGRWDFFVKKLEGNR